MANNITVSITADVADLQVKRAIMSAELRTATKDLNSFAAEAQKSGQTDELRTNMLGAADAVARTKNQISDLDRQLRTLRAEGAAQATAGLAAVESQSKSLVVAQSASVGMAGSQRQALIVVGEQFRQVSTEVALGIPPMQIFAQQAGQTIQAMSAMFGEASAVGAFLSGGWGIALTTAAAITAPLAAKLFETSDAMTEVKFSSDALNAAQNILGNVMDMTTGKIKNQNESLIALAHAQLAVARVESERRAADARAAIAESGKPQLQVSGGMGGGFSISREKQPGWQVESQFRNGMITADQAISKLEQLRDRGELAADAFGKLASAYANAGVEVANQKVYADAEKLLKGEGGQNILKPEKAKKERAERAASGGGTSDWTQELREQEIATGDFFSDQTERELAFWQSKVGLTRKGTREWLDVQGHIFDASRTLARQAYQDHLADLNLQIEADRNSWSKAQADWQEKLAFIRSKFGEQSAEYRDAAREWTRAQTQHDDQEIQQAQLHAQRMVDSLRRDLSIQAKLRDDDARAQETMLRANAENSPTGDITAAARVAQLHQQLAQQQLADTETLYSAQSAALDTAITKAVSRYGEEQANYQSLLDAKLQADQQYAAQKAQIESQARLQSIQDILAVRSSYRSYIDGTVNASVSAFDGLISGQKTWGQAAGSVYQSVVRQAEAQFARMATNWIVNHVLMTTAQRTQLALQSAAQATGEAAKTGAVVAGTAARTATTATGAAASATITGTHNAKEIISHAATAAAAAYHAMAGIPVVGPVLGAAAAVATFSAVAAFGALASFDKGTNILPNDMIAQVHAGERIVPAADNAKLLELTARGAGSTGGAASKDGDIHLHYQPTINGQMSFGDQLSGHEDNIIAILRRARRRGAI